MGQLEELMAHRQSVENNIEKSFGTGFDLNDEFEKARSGVYADNAENRRLKRVGQKYGSSAAPDQGGAAPQGKKAEEGGQKSEGKADSGKLANYASDASDEALKRAAADKNAAPEVKAAAQAELKKRGGGEEGGSDKEGEKTDKPKEDAKGGFSSKTANAVESAFKELTSVYDDAMNDDGSMDEDAALAADEKFYDKISDLVMKEGLTEKDFRKIKDSNPSWKYGFDTDWDEINSRVKEKKESESDKRYAVKSVVEEGANKKTDAFLDKNVKHFQDILKPYGVKDLFSLQEKLEEDHEDDEKDPYGYKEYSKIYVKCLRQIPAKEFKDF